MITLQQYQQMTAAEKIQFIQRANQPLPRAPVSLCVVVKNDPLIKDCLLSFREHVEEIVVVDNGTTDRDTLIAIAQYANIHETFTDCNNADGMIEDFSMLRNKAFSLATQPWIIWCDADDLVTGAEALLDIVTECGNDSIQAFSFPYELTDPTTGEVVLRFYRERLFCKFKDNFRWTDPVHECVVPSLNGIMVDNIRHELTYRHQKKITYESGRNLRILQKHYKEVGDNISPRLLFYLGRECADNGLNELAIKYLSKYVNVGCWEDEQVLACLRLVELFQVKQDWTAAKKWSFRAISIKEDWGEGYFALAKTFYFEAVQTDNRRDWQRCVHFYKLGLALPPTQTKLFLNPNDRECEVHKFYNFALNKIGLVEEALKSVTIGMIKQPNNSMFIQNRKIYEDFLSKRQMTQCQMSNNM